MYKRRPNLYRFRREAQARELFKTMFLREAGAAGVFETCVVTVGSKEGGGGPCSISLDVHGQ